MPALHALLSSQHEVVAVLTQPDKPAGRGRKMTACPVKRAADAVGLRTYQPDALHESLIQAQLKALAADLLVVIAYGQLLPPEVLAIPRFGCVNIHASLLPRWRGAAPIQSALRAGDQATGVCLMKMDAGLDTGPVYSQVKASIDATHTGGSLHDHLAVLGAELLIRDLDALLEGHLSADPQTEAGVTYAPRIHKRDGAIDWSDSAEHIDCLIRAFNPWPVAYASIDSATVRCWFSALAKDQSGTAVPGSVLGLEGAALRVQTGDGVLALAELQLPGRGRISGRAFANARPIEGLVFGCGA